ncbi:MAG TPA: AAA-like domain-containing protein [Solirubrobacterales bacterium]|nr:AAA-like domain-containing protein [Solirubrobacterales bacterium]
MATSEFHVGGAIPADSPAYAERDFVQRCFEELSGGHWVVLLGPRQHGKTSGLARLVELLKDASVKVAQLSLQGMPGMTSNAELFEWIAGKVAEQLDVDLAPPDQAERAELDAWLAAAMPPEPTQVVIVFDEAAAVKDDDIRSNFYQQLRRLHDERNAPRSPNLGTGLTMLFSGTFEPKRLVNDDLASPFNVCRTVETEDLSKEAVTDLVERLGASQAAPLVDRALNLVGGQPFLLQYLFFEVERGDAATSPGERFDQAEEKLLAGDSEHLTDLLSAVVNDQPVRAIAQQVVEHDGVPFAATPEHRALVTLGFGRRDGSQLVARNRLYSEVASRHFLLASDQATAVTGKVAPPGAGSLNFMVAPDLRNIAEEMIEAGFHAYNAEHLRLAVIGLGSALEAILIDLLEQASGEELKEAKRKAHPSFKGGENKNDPNSWRLVNLVKVADKLPSLEHASVAGAHAVRELRNQVHPALVRKAGVPQADLEADFNVVRGVLGVVIREVS